MPVSNEEEHHQHFEVAGEQCSVGGYVAIFLYALLVSGALFLDSDFISLDTGSGRQVCTEGGNRVDRYKEGFAIH